jgi:aminomethyltransferase
MTTAVVELADRYRLAHEAALPVRHETPDAVQLEGATRLGFLQRMSTNDLAHLAPGSAAQTVLTDALARIVDVVWVVARAEDALVITSPGGGPTVRDWLRRYVLFGDDVRLSLVDGPWEQWGVYGPEAAASVAHVLPWAEGLAAGGAVEAPEGVAWGIDAPAGIRLLLRGEAARRARDRWPESNSEVYQALRIEAGAPAPAAEITRDALPFEIGLRGAVSLSKGCYIGQEILARMDSRGRQAWTMMGVRLEGECRPGAEVHQGTGHVGRLTSVAWSPRNGWIALALVRPAAVAEGGPITIGDERLPGNLVPLPFPAADSSS